MAGDYDDLLDDVKSSAPDTAGPQITGAVPPAAAVPSGNPDATGEGAKSDTINPPGGAGLPDNSGGRALEKRPGKVGRPKKVTLGGPLRRQSITISSTLYDMIEFTMGQAKMIAASYHTEGEEPPALVAKARDFSSIVSEALIEWHRRNADKIMAEGEVATAKYKARVS